MSIVTPPFLAGRTPSVVTVRDQAVCAMAEGLGFNWYSCYAPRTYPAPDDDARWQRILQHAEWLNMNFVRFGLSRHHDAAGNFAPGDPSFRQLQRLDAWAVRRDVSIMLDSWFPPKAFRFAPWEGAPTVWGGPPQPSVEHVDAFVDRFVVPFVRHCVVDLGCRSIRWYNHVNEPFGGNAYSTPPGVDWHARYVEIIRAIRRGLDAAGLDHVGQIGPDCHDLRVWPVPEMIAKGHDPDPHLAAYDLHNYHTRLDWAPDTDALPQGTLPLSEMMAQHCAPAIRHAHARGKPFFLTEVGTFYYGWKWGDPAGIARHDNVINELAFAVEAIKAGADGLLRWAWLNPGDQDGWWQLIETSDGSDRIVPDPYYGYGTLMRHVGLRAEVLATEAVAGQGQPAGLHNLAVRNRDGSRALILINDHYVNPVHVRIRFAGGQGALHRIATDHVRKYHVDSGWRQDLTAGAAEWEDVLSPTSITVYTTREP